MNKLSKIWTASIAYVALIVGAGSSVIFNILDMRSIRGDSFDGWDLFIAVLGPAMVVLMVEMFVSRLWANLPDLAGQVIRWTVTVAIGAVAMRVSWTHGHAFLLTRGQTSDVATMWPLAIDGLAIMATALIVAGRRGHVASGQSPDLATGHGLANLFSAPTGQLPAPGWEMASGHEPGQPWDGPVASAEDVAISEAAFRGQFTSTSDFRETLATQPDDPTMDISDALNRWDRGYQEAIGDLGIELADEAEAFVNGVATVKPKPPVPVITKVPEEAVPVIAKMLELGSPAKEIDQAIAEMCMVSDRTARRYRAEVEKRLKG